MRWFLRAISYQFTLLYAPLLNEVLYILLVCLIGVRFLKNMQSNSVKTRVPKVWVKKCIYLSVKTYKHEKEFICTKRSLINFKVLSLSPTSLTSNSNWLLVIWWRPVQSRLEKVTWWFSVWTQIIIPYVWLIIYNNSLLRFPPR